MVIKKTGECDEPLYKKVIKTTGKFLGGLAIAGMLLTGSPTIALAEEDSYYSARVEKYAEKTFETEKRREIFDQFVEFYHTMRFGHETPTDVKNPKKILSVFDDETIEKAYDHLDTIRDLYNSDEKFVREVRSKKLEEHFYKMVKEDRNTDKSLLSLRNQLGDESAFPFMFMNYAANEGLLPEDFEKAEMFKFDITGKKSPVEKYVDETFDYEQEKEHFMHLYQVFKITQTDNPLKKFNGANDILERHGKDIRKHAFKHLEEIDRLYTSDKKHWEKESEMLDYLGDFVTDRDGVIEDGKNNLGEKSDVAYFAAVYSASEDIAPDDWNMKDVFETDIEDYLGEQR